MNSEIQEPHLSQNNLIEVLQFILLHLYGWCQAERKETQTQRKKKISKASKERAQT